MRVRGICKVGIGVALLAAVACRQVEQEVVPTAVPPPATASAGAPLTRADLEALVAVRSKALQKLEESLEEVLRQGGDVGTRVKELSAAEREAAAAMGVEWRRYVWVREEVARLLTLQRQEEDVALLKSEVERALEELDQQLKVARDRASREFLQAQRTALEGQHAKLVESAQTSPARAEAMILLESFRAELAVQQSRQERLQRRIRDTLRSVRAKEVPEIR